MTKKEILEGNKLIAEFMGLKEGWWIAGEKKEKQFCRLNGTQDTPLLSLIGSRVYYSKDLIFNSDWLWLMSVVEEIEAIQLPSPSLIKVYFQITRDVCRIFKGEWDENKEGFISSYTKINTNKLEGTYYCVVEFIKWYNKETLKK